MQQIDKDNVLMRTEVLNKLNTPNVKPLIVTYPEAILERVVSRKELQAHTLNMKPGEKIDMEFMTEMLQQYGFSGPIFVWEPGQYAVRAESSMYFPIRQKIHTGSILSKRSGIHPKFRC